MTANLCEFVTPAIALYLAILVDNNIMNFFIVFPCNKVNFLVVSAKSDGDKDIVLGLFKRSRAFY